MKTNEVKIPYTPGPWRRIGGNLIATSGGGANLSNVSLIADCNDNTNKPYQSALESCANAAIMAAAPDLYDACIAVMAYLAPPASKFKENRDAAFDAVRKALAKVEEDDSAYN